MESPLNQRLRWSPPDVVYTPIDVTSPGKGIVLSPDEVPESWEEPVVAPGHRRRGSERRLQDDSVDFVFGRHFDRHGRAQGPAEQDQQIAVHVLPRSQVLHRALRIEVGSRLRR